MPHALQEKFQITVPAVNEPDDPWVSFESQRESQACVPQWDNARADDNHLDRFNAMPPGMDIDVQPAAQIDQMPLSMAGETDVSKDTNPEAYARGFKKREMKGTDDQYTGEHIDHFYGDAGGFVERNNYLDRE